MKNLGSSRRHPPPSRHAASNFSLNVVWWSDPLIMSCFSSPKFARAQDSRLCFLGSKFVYLLRYRFAHILNLYWSNQTFVYYLYPYYITNIYYSSSRQTMAQSRSYSCDKLTMRQAEWDVLDLITKFLQSSNEN
jgi:hypothetical protein